MLINSRVIHRFEAESRTIIEDAGDIDGIYDRTYEEYSSSQKRTVELDAEIKSKEVKSAKIRECCKKITEYESGLSEFDEQLWAAIVDHMTVSPDGSAVFTLSGGLEVALSNKETVLRA